MQYNGFRIRNILLWIVAQWETMGMQSLWQVLYLAERKHISMTGEWMLGDIWVAMKDGPVPLRTYTELMIQGWPTPRDSLGKQLVDSLRRVSMQAADSGFKVMAGQAEEECLLWAIQEAHLLGHQAIWKSVRGRAWERAGPDGELDPLEVALEGGADAPTLDHILKWRNEIRVELVESLSIERFPFPATAQFPNLPP